MKRFYPFLSVLQTEYSNLFSFYLPAFIGGILWTQTDCPLPLFGVLSAASICLLIFCFKKPAVLRPIVFLILFFLSGYSITKYHLDTTYSPTISKPLYHIDIAATVTQASPFGDTQKIEISDIRFLNRADIPTPQKIRLSYYNSTPILSKGSSIRVQAFLRPPAKPVIPGGYNEARALFFRQIGAVGTIEKIHTVQPQTTSPWQKLDFLRQVIASHIHHYMPTEAAQIAIPLTIGEQGVISPYIYQVFRGSGITHILSVSGFHLGLLVLFCFFIFRRVFALFPIIHHLSDKKSAAFLTLIIAFCYAALSGFHIPVLRALIMLSIVLIAILFDRNALSLRSLCLVAVGMLCFHPEWIWDIGFQLSFMATFILVSIYQPIWRFCFPNRPKSLLFKIIRPFLGFALIDLTMSLFLTPFIIYHFHQYALYSPIGNVVAGTAIAFIILPLLFLGILTMPIGGDILFFRIAGFCLEGVIAFCEKISNLPYALINIPTFPISVLCLISIGLFCCCVMKTKCRFIGIALIGLAIAIAYLAPRPDILIGDFGQTIATYQNGQLTFLKKGKSDYTAHQWLLHFGQDPNQEIKPLLPDISTLKGKRVAWTTAACSSADICFLMHPNPRQHNAHSLLHSPNLAVFIDNDKIHIKTP